MHAKNVLFPFIPPHHLLSLKLAPIVVKSIVKHFFSYSSSILWVDYSHMWEDTLLCMWWLNKGGQVNWPPFHLQKNYLLTFMTFDQMMHMSEWVGYFPEVLMPWCSCQRSEALCCLFTTWSFFFLLCYLLMIYWILKVSVTRDLMLLLLCSSWITTWQCLVSPLEFLDDVASWCCEDAIMNG